MNWKSLRAGRSVLPKKWLLCALFAVFVQLGFPTESSRCQPVEKAPKDGEHDKTAADAKAIEEQICQSLGDPPKKGETKPMMIEWGPEKSGVRCAVVLPSNQQMVPADNPVYVYFLTKNIGAKPISVLRAPLLVVFDITVLAPDGKPSPLTSYGRRRLKADGDGSVRREELTTGEERKIQLHLSRIYDMTQAGEYKVFFSRSISGLHFLKNPECP